MSNLLAKPPFGPRDDAAFLEEMISLTRHHLERCDEYRRIWPGWNGAKSIAGLPFTHVGVFKHVMFRTLGVTHQRVLQSSGTSGARPSLISLDEESSALQSQSCVAVLSDFIGSERVPLLVLDDARSLRRAGEISARVAAAMSLRPLSTEILFLLNPSGDVRWDLVMETLSRHRHIRVYGFTTILWQSWASGKIPSDVLAQLRQTRVDFVHSGGWKKLEAQQVTREVFDQTLLSAGGSGTRVVDYYGLVEQVGILFPLCSAGFRHVPAWADVLPRDPYTLSPADAGMLQLMNVLARGAPYHSVLTEDLGRIAAGGCECGRSGKRFELLGRIPRSETRGCANV